MSNHSQPYPNALPTLDPQIWEATTRRCVLSMSNHSQAVTAVKWGGEGLIYSASRDCTISVWDATDGKLVGVG